MNYIKCLGWRIWTSNLISCSACRGRNSVYGHMKQIIIYKFSLESPAGYNDWSLTVILFRIFHQWRQSDDSICVGWYTMVRPFCVVENVNHFAVRQILNFQKINCVTKASFWILWVMADVICKYFNISFQMTNLLSSFLKRSWPVYY